jgi:hypothetical protein
MYFCEGGVAGAANSLANMETAPSWGDLDQSACNDAKFCVAGFSLQLFQADVALGTTDHCLQRKVHREALATSLDAPSRYTPHDGSVLDSPISNDSVIQMFRLPTTP